MNRRMRIFVSRLWLALTITAGSTALAQNPKASQPKPDPKPAATTAAGEVTLTGVLISKGAYARGLSDEEIKKENEVPLFLAFDGTPEIAAAYQDVFKELIAGNSLNYQQARAIDDGIDARLKFFITPGPATDTIKKEWSGGNVGGCSKSVTGVISQEGGKKWITPSAITKLPPPKYPPGMYAPDKPFKKPGDKPLILNVTDKLTLKCILLPRGEFMMEVPNWVLLRYADEASRHITLTKPFWLAEIPVTQEMWDAVMGAETDHATLTDPKRPARNLVCADVLKFLKILSEKNGRTVRLPGEAEWEYAMRAGTSNPPFRQKYKAFFSTGGAGECLPVKSKEPNAWGLYDMNSGAFELVRDKNVMRSGDAVDPYYSCEAEEAAGKKHSHWSKSGGGRSDLPTYHEWAESTGGKTDVGYGSTKIRIAVDATKEEIAEMEKLEKPESAAAKK